MSDPDDLRARIEKARAATKPRQHRDPTSPGGGAIGRAITFSSTFFAAILVGIFIGIGIDKVAGSGPWGLLVFGTLGTAAGFLNLIRAARQLEAEARRETETGPEGGPDQDHQAPT